MITARNLYLLTAREISTDSNDNMNSIIKIIDRFTSSINKDELEKNNITPGDTPIGTPINYSVASLWLFNKSLSKETPVKIIFETIDPKNKSIGSVEQKHNIPAGNQRMSFNVNFSVLPITTEGTYKIKARLLLEDGKEIATAEYPYEVQISWLGKTTEK